MMHPNEVRTGNLIIDPAFFPKRMSDEIIVVSHQIIKNIVDGIDYKPIPLTEEWLIKFGFEDIEDFIDAVNMDSIIELIYDSRVKIEYVHQLQNLYFALTGEELTIKEHEKVN